MLGTDPAVAPGGGRPHRPGQHLLRLRGERHSSSRPPERPLQRAGTERRVHGRADLVPVDPHGPQRGRVDRAGQVVEHPRTRHPGRGERLSGRPAVVGQRGQQVTGADPVRAHLLRRIDGTDHHPPGLLREPLEHHAYLPRAGSCRPCFL